jgi:hypothetical protein
MTSSRDLRNETAHPLGHHQFCAVCGGVDCARHTCPAGRMGRVCCDGPRLGASVIAHVRSLGRMSGETLTGDAQRGAALYRDKANCAYRRTACLSVCICRCYGQNPYRASAALDRLVSPMHAGIAPRDPFPALLLTISSSFAGGMDPISRSTDFANHSSPHRVKTS